MVVVVVVVLLDDPGRSDRSDPDEIPDDRLVCELDTAIGLLDKEIR